MLGRAALPRVWGRPRRSPPRGGLLGAEARAIAAPSAACAHFVRRRTCRTAASECWRSLVAVTSTSRPALARNLSVCRPFGGRWRSVVLSSPGPEGRGLIWGAERSPWWRSLLSLRTPDKQVLQRPPVRLQWARGEKRHPLTKNGPLLAHVITIAVGTRKICLHGHPTTPPASKNYLMRQHRLAGSSFVGCSTGRPPRRKCV